MLAISSLEEEERDIPILSEGSEVYDQLYPMEDQSVVDIEDCGVGLPVEQRRELHRVMMGNLMVFHGSPGRTTLVEHELHTGDALPICQKPY